MTWVGSIMVTSMQVNQKSFGLEDSAGNLLPHFVTVLNLTPPDVELVKHGWERVLRARLEDARFFWHEDLKNSFDKWLEELEHVVFIRGLGTMGDKTRRLEKLCRAEQRGRVHIVATGMHVPVGRCELLARLFGHWQAVNVASQHKARFAFANGSHNARTVDDRVEGNTELGKL